MYVEAVPTFRNTPQLRYIHSYIRQQVVRVVRLVEEHVASDARAPGTSTGTPQSCYRLENVGTPHPQRSPRGSYRGRKYNQSAHILILPAQMILD